MLTRKIRKVHRDPSNTYTDDKYTESPLTTDSNLDNNSDVYYWC